MLNNLFGGRTGGAWGEGTTTNPLPGQSSLFDDAEDLTDYVDHLPPVPGGTTITQEDQGTTPVGGSAVAAGGATFTPDLTPPHTGGGGGMGGDHPPRGLMPIPASDLSSGHWAIPCMTPKISKRNLPSNKA